MIKCNSCKQTGKGRYSSFYLEVADGKSKLVTLCDDCRRGPRGKTDKARWEELQTPFYKLMGLKPKPREVKLEKYLKSKNLSWADYRRLREYGQAKHQSAYKQFENHYNNYGTKNAPEMPFNKNG